MNPKERLQTAWRFAEPDRVPLEMQLYPPARGLPGADEIVAFQENEASNFCHVPGFAWGFMGLDAAYDEEVIEDVPGAFKRIRRRQRTAVGPFTAVTQHFYGDGDPNDYHWEKRYVETRDDFERLATAERRIRPFDREAYNRGCRDAGERGLPCTGLFHPLGTLVRNSNMAEAYAWLLTEEGLVLRYLEACTEQIVASLLAAKGAELADPIVFMTYALEMLIPPWLGMDHFDRLVFPYDRRVNEAVHAVGGRHRAHCHGNSGAYLERFADMGIDGVEPLEPPPYGDNDLADAKRRVGRRMLLSGNIPSQAFHLSDFKIDSIRDLVWRALDAGAPGGGFTLHTTGGAVGNGKTREQCIRCIDCNRTIIEAWRAWH